MLLIAIGFKIDCALRTMTLYFNKIFLNATYRSFYGEPFPLQY